MTEQAPVRLVLATHNAHKVEELRRILGSGLDGITLLGYDGPEPVEDGDTFAANALIKARAAAAHTGLPAIADDSGICVEALGGAPGIHSARYAGTRDDGDNLRLLLHVLAGVTDRAANFTCAAALVVPAALTGAEEDIAVVEVAEWQGSVADVPNGGGGFGYDPIFVPADADLAPGTTAADLAQDEKDRRSHRAMAFGALVPHIRRHLFAAN